MNLRYDANGLIPAVVQDARSQQVLMVAWMNAEALRLTRETGLAHFWSRSRRELWRKGATSGNLLRVQQILADCDADTLLLRVLPAGPACHTGAVSCFFRSLDENPAQGAGEGPAFAYPSLQLPPKENPMLAELFAVIQSRRTADPQTSYTARLFAQGQEEILKKVGEEAVEVILAAAAQGDQRLIEESADLLYHLLVLLAARGLSLAAVEEELARRHRPQAAP